MGDTALTTDCLEGLRAAMPPDAEVEVCPSHPADGDRHPAGVLRIRGPQGEIEIPVETRRRVNPATVALIDRGFGPPGLGMDGVAEDDHPRWVLFTEYVNAHQARDLRAAGIAFADTRGNAHLWGPGLHVWVAGHRPAAGTARAPGLVRPAPARVLFALLQDPHRAQEPYRELAARAGVAPDTVKRVFHDLQAKGYLKVWGTRERELMRLPELVEVWILAYEDALRPRLQPKRFQWGGGGPVEDLVALLPLGPEAPPVLLGGEVAVALLTDGIRPATATLHVLPGTQRQVLRALDLVPRPDGPITLLHTFGATNAWARPEGVHARLVDPLLIHAELMRMNDDRVRAAAEDVYDHFVERRFADAP